MSLPPDVLRRIANRADPRTAASIALAGREGRNAARAGLRRRANVARRVGFEWRLFTASGGRLGRAVRKATIKALAIVRLVDRGGRPERALGPPRDVTNEDLTSRRIVWWVRGDGRPAFYIPGVPGYTVSLVRTRERLWLLHVARLDDDPDDPVFVLSLDTQARRINPVDIPEHEGGEWNVVGVNVFGELLDAGFSYL